MGAKDSKLSCISYEEAIKRGNVILLIFFIVQIASVGLCSFTNEKKKTYKNAI